MTALIPDPSGVDGMVPDRRMCPREYVTIAVTVRERFWAGQNAELINMSTGGCRISGIALKPGDLVWVKIETLASLEARVVWAVAWEAGLNFRQPLHPAVFDHLVKTTRKPGAAPMAKTQRRSRTS